MLVLFAQQPLCFTKIDRLKAKRRTWSELGQGTNIDTDYGRNLWVTARGRTIKHQYDRIARSRKARKRSGEATAAYND